MEKRQGFNWRAKALMDVLRSQGRKQRWLAEQVDISESHLSRIVSGERLTDHQTADRIAKALGVSLFSAFELTSVSDISLIQERIPA